MVFVLVNISFLSIGNESRSDKDLMFCYYYEVGTQYETFWVVYNLVKYLKSKTFYGQRINPL